METKPKVSVIMPSLNVGDYIRQCIESVVNQTLKEIEILCIDAGSTDGTLEILREYAEKDPRIRLEHSEVRSYGHQMNMGLSVARGEYIGIVETDDYIAPEMFEKLFAAACAHEKPDVVKSPYYRLNPPGDIRPPLEVWRQNQAADGAVFSLSENYALIGKHPSIWSCIYKKSFLDSRNIRFQELPGGGWADNLFFYRTLCEAERICWVNEPFYYYRRNNPNSSSILKDCSIPMARINDLKDYLETNFPEDCTLERRLCFRMLLYIDELHRSPYLTNENRKEILATVRRFPPKLLARVYIGKQYRALMKALKDLIPYRREKVSETAEGPTS